MYTLTLTAAGYNRIKFVSNDLSELTHFLIVAMRLAEGELEAKITKAEKEGEEECSLEN